MSPTARRRTIATTLLAAAAAVLTSCASGRAPAGPSATRPAASHRDSGPGTVAPATTPEAPQSAPRSTPQARPRTIALPRGGTRILGTYRVIAYYGGPDGPALGALGNAGPNHMAKVIINRAKQFAGHGRRLQPAMELIASVAQASPGPDGLYSATIPPSAVRRYLAVAHRYRMLLILDFQPGRGEFLPQVKQFAAFLRDPSVEVALDPEWKVGKHQVPGQVIGSARAKSINAVTRYLSRLVTRNHLPDKLLMVHEFTASMLPDRNHIVRAKGIQPVFHADGFGSRAEKVAAYHRLRLPGYPFGSGFKLFLTQDTGRLMTPKQVLSLRPRPDVVTFQ